MADNLPSPATIALLLARIDALIGLASKYPARRSPIEASTDDKQRYGELWREAEAGFNEIRQAGFPIANPNLHADIESIWAWCIGFGGTLNSLRTKPRQLYAGTIEDLAKLRELLLNADAPIEVQREFRESALRTNEIFMIMAFRAETSQFRAAAKSAAIAAGLTPVLIDEQETENAISEAILSSIRRSTLVLCDLSFERPNCYFEAGFAKGAMRRVLFSCRKDHDPRRGVMSQYRVHFDVDQLKITWWSPDQLDEAKNELEARFRVLLDELRPQR